MPLQITHLGTGSKGNSTLISSESNMILVDQGFSVRRIEHRLDLIGVHPSEIDAILVSHHHGDHGGGAMATARRWGCPVYANKRTAEALNFGEEIDWHPFEGLQRIDIGDKMAALPIPVRHDGAENVAFVISDRTGVRIAIVSDLGTGSVELINHLRGCQHISIEANYDPRLLNSGPYPSHLKARILSNGGHLSNAQTAAILSDAWTPELRSITLIHLSQMNNRPHAAESEVLCAIEDRFEGELIISGQEGPDHTIEIGVGQMGVKPQGPTS